MAARKRLFMVADKIRAIIATELHHVADPRLDLVTITSVVPSPDLRHAKIYWVVSGDAGRRAEVETAFEASKGFFKRALAKDLGLKFVPDLHFYYDDTLDTVRQVEDLFNKVKQKRDNPA